MRKRLFVLAAVLVFYLVGHGEHIYSFRGLDGMEVFKADDLKGALVPGMQQEIMQLNRQLPIRIDELTELTSAVMVGLAINYNYTVSFDSRLFSEQEVTEFCKEIKGVKEENIRFLFKQNEDKMPVEEWAMLYKEMGIKYNYNYVDVNGRVFAKIVIDFNEF